MGFPFKFGTAGIRARSGAAPHELNLDSVRTIAWAIARHLAAGGAAGGDARVCVAYDGRQDSQAFADEVCAVLLAQGFRVQRFSQPTPTPLLAFAVRSSAAAAGITITASHNPPEDNGLKLYLAGGCQIAAPVDTAIEQLIVAADPRAIPLADLPAARAHDQLLELGASEQARYLQAIQSLVPSLPELPLPRVAYSALCGVGSSVARGLFSRLGAHDVVEVAEQAEPRADFGGLVSPNPEEPSALALLREYAEREDCALAFAHDPDADRLAVLARRAGGPLRALSGDQVGALLGDFLLSLAPAPARTLLVSTLVSGGLLERICAAYGAPFLRTPTGFKWIAKLGRERAAKEQLELLFGYEEALGYAFFALADDKDGSAALYVLCELARRLAQRGASLLDRVDELSGQHGCFVSRQINVVAAGPNGPAHIAGVMQRLRAVSPEQLLGPGARCVDHAGGAVPVELLVFDEPEGTRICVRPSGTEPKLKLYLHAREPVRDGVASAEARAGLRLDGLAATLAPLIRE
jgi:phosphomannomutase